MRLRSFKYVFTVICITLSMLSSSNAQSSLDEQNVKVVMREVGHKILLFTGDITSLVLPIDRVENRYKIEFENEFEIDPFDLASIVDSVIKKNELSNRYRVEVETCGSKYLAHSFELGDSIAPSEIACKGRILPKDCYKVYVTFLDTLALAVVPDAGQIQVPIETSTAMGQSRLLIVIVLSIPLAFFIGLFIYYRRKRSYSSLKPSLIRIGKFDFDQRNQILQYTSEKIELSSKESDLLYLLHSSANTVLKREDILNAVWGDEGDYIGRTLDVFISKLRKKLAADASLKIVNVHGVGYKLVVNG